MSKKLFKNLLHKIDKKEAIKWLTIIILIIFLSLLISRYIGQETIEQRVIKAGILWPILLISWKAISVILIPFSWSIIYIISWGLYSTFQATMIGVIGNAIGMSISFFIWRKRGEKAVTWFVGTKHIDEVIHLINHLSDAKTFAITRIVLFPIEDFINYAGGMSQIPFSIYFTISIIIVTVFSLVPIIFGNLLI